jgi:hypothetical protein
MKGYKGYDKNFKCRDFQYEVGKEYKTDKAKICESGFHFCENPLDIFNYYSTVDSKFTEVEGLENIVAGSDDTKISCTHIKIGVELSLSNLVFKAVDYILSKIDFTKKQTNTGDRSASTNTGYRSAATNTGDSSAATNTGYSSAATNTGYRSAATNTGDRSASTNTGDSSAATNTGDRSASTNTGYRSAATNTGDSSAATNTGTGSASIVTGKQSIACALGIGCKAKGAKGCYLVLAERVYKNNDYILKSVKAVKVDGKKIKEDTFYMLKNGKFMEVE